MDTRVTRLNHTFVGQITQFKDISTAEHKQVEEDDEASDEAAEVKFESRYLDKKLAITERKKQSNARVAYLTITDGKHSIFGLEDKPISFELQIGALLEIS